MTPGGTGPGRAPGAFKSLVRGWQVQACSRLGGAGTPALLFLLAVLGAGLGGPVPEGYPGLPGVHPTLRPSPSHWANVLPSLPTLRRQLPELGPKGVATSHEAPAFLSLSTHTTQSCGKKKLVQSFAFPVVPEFENPRCFQVDAPTACWTHPLLASENYASLFGTWDCFIYIYFLLFFSSFLTEGLT